MLIIAACRQSHTMKFMFIRVGSKWINVTCVAYGKFMKSFVSQHGLDWSFTGAIGYNAQLRELMLINCPHNFMVWVRYS